ncbi:hypothetical protein BC936DRAFT_136572 [Jimgerdemannia flammicorona]|uniref:Uncharacterized protein n=1 Tax=Jimgerdemannia flammicorona TaxID=994334 RepID=A0A433CZ88_9FUNG|nr:hypothetical protein BC936DRAFT_136572 [Jimgerdemannia flammicorona]
MTVQLAAPATDRFYMLATQNERETHTIAIRTILIAWQVNHMAIVGHRPSTFIYDSEDWRYECRNLQIRVTIISITWIGEEEEEGEE